MYVKPNDIINIIMLTVGIDIYVLHINEFTSYEFKMSFTIICIRYTPNIKLPTFDIIFLLFSLNLTLSQNSFTIKNTAVLYKPMFIYKLLKNTVVGFDNCLASFKFNKTVATMEIAPNTTIIILFLLLVLYSFR